jgi:hypothetical protein|tara:strand:- start:142 stop:393 length:252 start_codon:yes stop_codon:yes gene_type:complete
MKKIRKVDTNTRKKKRKEAEKALQQRTAMFLDHPKECCMCKTSFERTKETVKTWQVVAQEDRVRLTCPECWAILLKTLEKDNK